MENSNQLGKQQTDKYNNSPSFATFAFVVPVALRFSDFDCVAAVDLPFAAVSATDFPVDAFLGFAGFTTFAVRLGDAFTCYVYHRMTRSEINSE